MSEVKLILGDCLEKMKEIPDESIDCVITDPPYELGFMGKKWDATGIAYNTNVWKDCLRILKPGGHLLSFGGTRTYHRMAVAIEDAGFEIRDMIEWVYASGFPKSLNIGKAYDKMMGNEREVIGKKPYTSPDIRYNNLMNSQGKERLQRIDDKGTSKYEGQGTALKPAHESICVALKPFKPIPLNISDDWNILWELNSFVKIAKELSKLNLQDINEDMLGSVLKNAELKNNILGDLKEVMDILQSKPQMVNIALNTILLWKNIWEEILNLMSMSTTGTRNEMITDLKTLKLLIGQLTLLNIILAKDNQVDGKNMNVLIVEKLLEGVLWKLKGIHTLFVQENVTLKEEQKNSVPKHEPIVLARKPLSEETVVDNVVKWGTGGLDIEGCKIPLQDEVKKGGFGNGGIGFGGGDAKNVEWQENTQGRFPANLICQDDALNDGEITKANGHWSKTKTTGFGKFGCGKYEYFGVGEKDNTLGSKSRFFDLDVWAEKQGLLQFPKAGKSERNKGCEDLEPKAKCEIDTMGGDKCTMKTGSGNERNTKYLNNHPTVKPTKLMAWLIRLVAPQKDMVVLDPFMGSGTTGVAAVNLDRNFIGIELDEGYFNIAKKRIEDANKQEKLF